MLFERKLFILALLGLCAATPVLAHPPDVQTGAGLHGPTLLAAHIDTRAGIENIQERRAAVAEETASPLTWNAGARLTLSGLIEAESSLVHVEGGDEENDLRLSTVRIGLDAEITQWLGGHIIGLWEEDATEPMVIDEAVLTLTSPWQTFGQTPALHLGRQYLPFGKFHSGMISDPLTLELGEATHTTAALLALEGERWSARIGAFKGSVDDGDDGVDSWVAAVVVTPRAGLTLGASWLSDLAESDAGLVRDEGPYHDEVPAWSAFITVQRGNIGLTAEYLAAAINFASEQVEVGGDLAGRRPKAWNLELSWQPVDQVQLAARYEAARDYQADIHRYGATVSYGLCENALLAFEYLHADAVGTPPAHAFTAQLAVEF